MSPQELAAIVARDAEWRPDRDGRPNWVRHTLMTNTDRGQEFTAAVSDRRALLALLRETRDEIAVIHDRLESAFNLMHPGELTDDERHGMAQHVWFAMEECDRCLAALGQP